MTVNRVLDMGQRHLQRLLDRIGAVRILEGLAFPNLKDVGTAGRDLVIIRGLTLPRRVAGICHI